MLQENGWGKFLQTNNLKSKNSRRVLSLLFTLYANYIHKIPTVLAIIFPDKPAADKINKIFFIPINLISKFAVL